MDVTFETKHGNKAGKDEWLTPPEIIKALGEFDLDPCSPINRPWETARRHYTIEDDGLTKEWSGRVFCNPPYGDQAKFWLKKCVEHKNVIALTFARTETKMFFESIWNHAHSVFFFQGRLKFYHVSGTQGDAAGAPSMLISYNKENTEAIRNSGLKGKLVVLSNES